MATGNGDGGRSEQEELLEFLVVGWRRFRDDTMKEPDWLSLSTELDKYHSCFSLGIITGLMAVGVDPIHALFISDSFISVPSDQ